MLNFLFFLALCSFLHPDQLHAANVCLFHQVSFLLLNLSLCFYYIYYFYIALPRNLMKSFPKYIFFKCNLFSSMKWLSVFISMYRLPKTIRTAPAFCTGVKGHHLQAWSANRLEGDRWHVLTSCLSLQARLQVQPRGHRRHHVLLHTQVSHPGWVHIVQ